MTETWLDRDTYAIVLAALGAPFDESRGFARLDVSMLDANGGAEPLHAAAERIALDGWNVEGSAS